jgi:DNA-binding NtrC family response regulator
MEAHLDDRPVGASRHPRGRVLVVDDEPLIRWSMGVALASAQYEVIEAGDGATAQSKAANGQTLDAALLDLRLPDIDGVTLLEKLRRAHPECQFLIMTALRTPELARLRDVPILDKPFSLDDLVEHVHQAVGAGNHTPALEGCHEDA